jgi:hypothetical protein
MLGLGAERGGLWGAGQWEGLGSVVIAGPLSFSQFGQAKDWVWGTRRLHCLQLFCKSKGNSK